MNRPLVAIALPLALLSAQATGAKAALVISKDPSRNVTCSNEFSCSATKANANLNVRDLSKLLNARDLTLIAGSEALDIDFKVPFAWTRPRTLTLQAHRSVVFEEPVTVQGAGSLDISTNYPGGSGGALDFVNRGKVDFWDASSNLTINSQPYTLVSDLPTLAQRINANSYGYIALIKDYDASADGVYSGSPAASFSGALEGLGHKISNLSINDPSPYDAVGLIGTVDEAEVRNIGLPNATIVAQDSTSVGALIGSANEIGIEHCYVTGTVQGGQYSTVGGLIGGLSRNYGYYPSTVRDSRSFARVSGGLYSTAGGLIGTAGGSQLPSAIENTYATGKVIGGTYVGGLVGYASGPAITDSHATGAVAMAQGQSYGYAGGLAGSSSGDIQRAYSLGYVKASDGAYAGGLVGWGYGGKIYWTYANGSVKAGDSATAGGLIGDNENADVRFSYATGAVSIGQNGYAGGLVGQHRHLLSYSFSTGAVTAGTGSTAGGAVGADYGRKDVFRVYWDTDTSGISDASAGAGNPPNDYGIAPLTSAELQSGLPRGFDRSMWARDPGINNGFPYLRSVPPPQ
ncbi:MAG TPA: GLUG motif-containing protein [Rhizomicrobium sp.]